LREIGELCFGHCPLTLICVPHNAEVLGKQCFSGSAIAAITFEEESQLTRIEAFFFDNCSLVSIYIPQNVAFIDGSAFANCECQSVTIDPDNHRFSIDRDFLIDATQLRLVRYIGSSDRICIWTDIEVLGKSCFDHSGLESITFGHQSLFKRIEESCFANCSLKSILIPRNVEFIDGSAFVSCQCESVTVDPSNRRFVIDRSFLIDKIEQRLIRYLGTSCHVHIWNDVKIIGRQCFASALNRWKGIDTVTFEKESRLQQIDESCFSDCSLRSIWIPRRVEILGKSCFSGWSWLESIAFESGSLLSRIEEWCFHRCSLEFISIPSQVVYLDPTAFDCNVAINREPPLPSESSES
jgi:hypothetical protein